MKQYLHNHPSIFMDPKFSWDIFFWSLILVQHIGANQWSFRNAVLLFAQLKVSKSRKQILKFSFEPKNERKYFCISALASKMGQIIKIIAHYHANWWLFII